jgi:hypothetical protein
MTDTSIYRFHHHHHAGTTPKWVIIHLPMLGGAKIPEVYQVNFYKSFLNGSFYNRMGKGTGEQLGMNGNDVNPHAAKVRNWEELISNKHLK